MKQIFPTQTHAKCYHCGENCELESVSFDNKKFCCQGCKLVYEVLAENDLCEYYQLETSPGKSQKERSKLKNRFDYLDDPEVSRKLLDFQNDQESHITFYIPLIHCASCIWLLENLFQINSAILGSRVDFVKKKAQIKFLHDKISLKEVVSLLSTLGYEPKINLSDLDHNSKSTIDRRILTKLGVAGFCFGNMMLFSMPEYFSEAELLGEGFKGLFDYLNVVLSLPIVFYAASDYYLSAWNAVRQRKMNMDVPIVLGIIAFFFYSLWEIFSQGNAGYMDSLGGLLFFLLLGKVYQQKTFATLEFDRDYKAYFPIAVTRMAKEMEEVIPLVKLQVGDVVLVRDEELIPADSLLLSEFANIDYSFVTGEEVPVPKRKGELIYAGGRQKGDAVLLTIQKAPSQSYLTDLWNNESFEKSNKRLLEPLANRISGVFTWTVLTIAVVAFVFWIGKDVSIAVKAFTTVLIVACPCALSMSTPFTLGNTLRIFGKGKFYLKNASVVERLALVDTLVFDKTGTLTDPAIASIEYFGVALSAESKSIIKGMVERSTHPLSNRINLWLGKVDPIKLGKVQEIKGAGILAEYKDQEFRLGSKDFTGSNEQILSKVGNHVFFSLEGIALGQFHIQSGLREGAPEVVKSLSCDFELHVLSGDQAHEKVTLGQQLSNEIRFNFNQSPVDKLNYLKELNSMGKNTMMLGDGLNDSGALQESQVGIAITDRVSHFSPASDAILDVESFDKIPSFLAFAKDSRLIIKTSFGLSFLYNILGLSLAVQGLLSPVFCAILMPLSSISVVVFTTLATNYMGIRKGLIYQNKQ
ncbi:heavy metal translocating P-type ATPase metal-binding domain-containing protein [Algoriphagus sp. A40]|uniref:heavy metal translocating P-type ATPase n=1 Tax=Algoriphagus sp. A40 TaxID=1945863 RepID=UPI00098431C7|nr:heavy metal translocating P-type ATPase metal-binding domain-containing protein [Algoriphagus sp. A40]OOG78021.1 ATPase [Algoriphagus sp. A40]